MNAQRTELPPGEFSVLYDSFKSSNHKVMFSYTLYMYGGLTFHSNAFFFLAVLFELNRVTTSQAKQYLIICRDKFMKSQIEPGTGTRSLIQV